jgi:hypothetical protein
MNRFASVAILFCIVCWSGYAQEEEERTPILDSPNGRFTLRVSVPDDVEKEAKLDIVEKASGKVVGDLGTDYRRIRSDIKLVWSAESTRLAYRTAGQKQWSTNVYFWNGSDFESVNLPEDLPSPSIKFRKDDETGGVKNYGGGEEPMRWLKSGDLEVISEQTQMARESGRTYTATITITIHFDKQHHASVKSVSKSKTKIDE